MREQIQIQNLLNERLEEARKKNPAYSLRAFAKRLDVNPSTLTRLLNGERRVSRPLAEKFCLRLSLDPQERSDVLSQFPAKRIYKKKVQAKDEVDSSYLQLTADQFKIVGEWYHFAILSLIRIDGFSDAPVWLSQRLGISVQEARGAMERLERIGMIEQDPKGQWVRTRPKVRTTDDILNISLQKSHRQNLEIAAAALGEVPVDLRDFTAMTLPMNPRLLPKAKEMIREFQDRLADLLESEPGTEVYKFCAQLVPLTKKQNQEKVK